MKCWLIFLLILAITSSRCVSGGANNCWNHESECIVQATLYKSPINVAVEEEHTKRETLPLEIDCVTTQSTNENNNNNATSASSPVSVTQPPDYLLRRFERAFAVILNGCHKGLKYPTFGFEYLPNCDKITQLIIEDFHADSLYAVHCTSSVTFMQLEVLRFEHNEIATISVEALSKLALLREIYFVANSLRHVERDAFNNLHFIERIQLSDEPLLAIKDASLIEHTNVAHFRLLNLKHVTSALFGKLPQTLREIYIEKTPIGVGELLTAATASTTRTTISKIVNYVQVNNSRMLQNLSLIDCDLSGFHLNDDHGSVKFLNLSSNLLVEFVISVNGTQTSDAHIKILDLSNNRLSFLPLSWLSMLSRVEQLYLRFNLIKQLPLIPVLLNLPQIQNIDLRNNLLETLSDTTAGDSLYNAETLYRVLIRIDKNPWNCKWLLKFAYSSPELFRIFHYEKFLSQINVNGLECVPEEVMYTKQPLNLSALSIAENNGFQLPISGDDSPQKKLNVSTFTLVYGNPYDLKRNQRTEALIIVFMLPVGIVLLFFLLYLWIYCQKVFHLSFYRKCRILKKRQQKCAVGVSNRFDVVRQVPTSTTLMSTANNNEDYEMPLNGSSPVCNCVNMDENASCCNTSSLSGEKCQKTHHITYVPLPVENAQTIYEEIIGDDNDDSDDAEEKAASHLNTIYDHLGME